MKLIYSIMAALAFLAAPAVNAWTYQDGDVLLIFRKTGSDDVEFDLGNISQFLNQPNGQTTAVTGWDPVLVSSTFGGFSGVSAILTATTSTNSWLTSSASVGSVNDLTPSAWHSQLYSLIDAIGARPTNYNETAAESNAYVIQELGNTTNGHSSLASYDYIVTGGGVSEAYIAEFGGNVNFAVEGVGPTTLGFWQITPSSPSQSAIYTGTFTIDTSGNLTFYAGIVPPPVIQGISRNGGVSSVSFQTLYGGLYSLAYTNTLGGPVSAWPIVAGPVTGSGGVQTLNYTNSADAAGYFGVIRSP